MISSLFIVLSMALTFAQLKTNIDNQQIDCEMFHAMVLIDTPPEIPIYSNGYSEERIKYIQQAIIKKSIQLQIVDEKERLFLNKQDFECDLTIIRKRWFELKEAPYVEESFFRFPSREQIRELIKFNRIYRKHLGQRLELEPDRATIIAAVIRETDECYQNWDLMLDASCEFYYITVRRQALLRFKNKMQDYVDENGKNFWETGQLPPSIPDWRFIDNTK